MRNRKTNNEILRQECKTWRLEEVVHAYQFYKLEPKNLQANDFTSILFDRMFEIMKYGNNPRPY
jgi:hypothetical protein